MIEVVDRLVMERDKIVKLIEDYENKISELKEEVNSDNFPEKSKYILEGLVNKDKIEYFKRNSIKKVCWYFNKGYCKKREYCKYNHETRDCIQHMEGQLCETTSCKLRHRSDCKYWKSGFCFRGIGCAYLYRNSFKVSTSVGDEIQVSKTVVEENETGEVQVRNTTDDRNLFEHKKMII